MHQNQAIVSRRVCTKINAPMMCLANVNQHLHNGTSCKFLAKPDNDTAMVEVNGAKFRLEKWRWTSKDDNGIVTGCRSQIPLKLNWASTVHKAQGSQLPKVRIHSQHEFTGGMLYVALSRVRSAKDAQLIGFCRDHLKDRGSELQEINSLCFREFEDDLSCCRREVTWSMADPVRSRIEIPNQATRSNSNEGCAAYADVREEFTRENVPLTEDDKVLHLEIVLEGLEDAKEEFAVPPPNFDVKELLSEMIDKSIMCDSLASQNKNRVIEIALGQMQKTELFNKILWRKIFCWLKKHIKNQMSDTTMTMKFLKDVTKKVWFITRDEEVRSLLIIALSNGRDKNSLEEADICFCSDLAIRIYQQILEIVAASVRQKTQNAAIHELRVSDMDNAGLSKIRFLDGCVVHQLLDQSKRYVNDNVYSQKIDVAERVQRSMKKVELLKERLIVPYEKIAETTKYHDTLDYTERRQYVSRGLLHISDEFYEFMLKLEQARVKHLKIAKYKDAGEKFLFQIRHEMTEDQEFNLREEFFKLFQMNNDSLHTEEEMVNIFYKSVV